MNSTACRSIAAIALMTASLSCVGADWDQVFRESSQQTTAKPEPAAAATPAATQPVTSDAARSQTARARASVTQSVSGAAATRAATRAASTAAQPAAPAQADAATADVTRGVELYRRGRISEAATVFENRALAAATPAEQSATLFRVGVQWHNEVLKAAPEQKAEIREAATSAYQKTLQINPRSGPALNNLAQLLKADPAKTPEADALLARAVALNDSRKDVYLMNRAELKRDAGDLQAATGFAMQAAAEDKNNGQAHQLVMSILVKREDAAELLRYISALDEGGLVVRALDSAAEGLARLPGARKPLLIRMATTLASDAYTADPRDFEKTDAGQALARFSADQAIGPGVIELFRVLREPVPAAALTWWREGFDGIVEPPKGTPAAALQHLARRCGDFHHARNDKSAEGYYQASVTISGKIGTDPRALLGLTEILYEQNRLDDLNRVLRENEDGLMQAKRQSMAASDDLHTYQLRVALGMMYGYVGRWVNPSQRYAASIWMLENAQSSAMEYNRRANLTQSRQLKLPPNAVKMLSTGYAKTDDAARSVTVRLEFADLYLKSGQKRFAQAVLNPEWQRTLPANLDAGLRQRLTDLYAQAGG